MNQQAQFLAIRLRESEAANMSLLRGMDLMTQVIACFAFDAVRLGVEAACKDLHEAMEEVNRARLKAR